MKITKPTYYRLTRRYPCGCCPACYLATEHSGCFNVSDYRYPFMDYLETVRDEHKGCTVIGGERVVVCHVYKENLGGKQYEAFVSTCNRAGIQAKVFGNPWYSDKTVRLEFRNVSLHFQKKCFDVQSA